MTRKIKLPTKLYNLRDVVVTRELVGSAEFDDILFIAGEVRASKIKRNLYGKSLLIPVRSVKVVENNELLKHLLKPGERKHNHNYVECPGCGDSGTLNWYKRHNPSGLCGTVCLGCGMTGTSGWHTKHNIRNTCINKHTPKPITIKQQAILDREAKMEEQKPRVVMSTRRRTVCIGCNKEFTYAGYKRHNPNNKCGTVCSCGLKGNAAFYRTHKCKGR